MSEDNLHDVGMVHEREISDDEGQKWSARQVVGIGNETPGMSLTSVVEFINMATGKKLGGRASGLGSASDEELQAALREAQRNR